MSFVDGLFIGFAAGAWAVFLLDLIQKVVRRG